MSKEKRLATYAVIAALAVVVIVLGLMGWPGRYPAPAPTPPGGQTPAPPSSPAPAGAYKTAFKQWTGPAGWQSGTYDHTVIASNGAITLQPGQGLPRGSDPGGAYGVSKAFYAGSYVTPVAPSATPFNWAVASWNADTPPGTWIAVEMRALRPGIKGSSDTGNPNSYTKWYAMGVWAAGADTLSRHSVANQADADGSVDTDTLKLSINAAGVQLRVTLCTTDPAVTPSVRRLAVITADSRMADTDFPADRTAWGSDIAVPERSQMIYGDQGAVWCSPTSTSMLMAYWAGQTNNDALDQSVPAVAAACYDSVFDGTGNWPFNTAAAAAYGLEAYVTRMQSLAQVEQWIKAGIPVAISISFKTGELTGAPPGDVPGHLIVVRGFDAKGDVICNDPEFSPPAPVRIVYRRDQLEKVWRGNGGVAYVVYPKGRAVPENPRGSWE